MEERSLDFLHIFFILNRRKEIVQVWNDTRARKWWPFSISQLLIWLIQHRKHYILFCIYWITSLVCHGGSGSSSFPSLLSGCVVSQICFAAVGLLSYGLQFYDIYHRHFPPHRLRPHSGLPQGSILGSQICEPTIIFAMAFWSSPLSTVRSEWTGNEVWVLLLLRWQTTHPRLYIKDFRERFTTKDFPLHAQGIMGHLSHKHNSQALYEISSQYVTCFVDQKRKMPHM